jgi:organic hydroperoxide reductase OsmC/OhrA
MMKRLLVLTGATRRFILHGVARHAVPVVEAEQNCPVSKVLKADITLEATLV